MPLTATLKHAWARLEWIGGLTFGYDFPFDDAVQLGAGAQMTFGFPALALALLLHRNPVLVCAVSAEAIWRGVDPVLACSLVEEESRFNDSAYSSTDDFGLFQINRRQHGVHLGADHIRAGLSLLTMCISASRGSILYGLSRYNSGRVCQMGLRYARRILARKARLDKALGRNQSWQPAYFWQLSRSGPLSFSSFMPCVTTERRKWGREDNARLSGV